MARSWSARARRDFREREEYRKRNDEKDRYEKRDSDDRRDDRRSRSDEELRRDAREDRREERGWWNDYDDYEAYLMEVRNAGPDDDVDEKLERLRRSYDYYEAELDKYDADYDELMRKYKEVVEDNRKYMMRDAVDDGREEGRVVDKQQNDDIVQDGEEMTYEDLWKTREG